MRAAITMGSLAAVAALTTLAACASRDTNDASAGEAGTSAAPRSGTVNVGDATINYEISGQGAPLVLIHGWSQDLLIWDAQARDFAARYRVLRYDPPFANGMQASLVLGQPDFTSTATGNGLNQFSLPLAVARDADDLGQLLLPGKAEPLADGLFARPEPGSHGLVDDDDLRRLGCVGRAEGPAGHEGNADGLEVVIAGQRNLDEPARPGVARVLPFLEHRPREAAAEERCRVGQAGACDDRERSRALENLALAFDGGLDGHTQR